MSHGFKALSQDNHEFQSAFSMRPIRRRAASLFAAAVIAAGLSAHGATLNWDTTGTPASPGGGTGTWDLSTLDWSNLANDVAWSDASAVGTDSAVFGGASGTVTLNSSVSALGLQFNTGGYTLSGSGTLTLGAGGISATGSETISSNLKLAAGAQTWNVATGQTLTVNPATLTRNTGAALIVQGGTGTVATTSFTNTNGIIGPWALVNNAGNYSYASVTSGNITAYTGATLITINTGAWGNIPSGGTGTVNYDINSGGTYAQTGLGRNVNTIRYLGTGAIQTSNSGSANNTLMTINGFINDGTGAFVIGVTGTPSTGFVDLVFWTNNELVLGAMTANITLNNFIKNGAAAGSVTIIGGAGPNNVVTINGANTYTGATNIDSGSLVITNAAGLSASSGTFIRSGGTLDVQGNLTSAGVTGLSVIGTGTGGSGALVSSTTGTLGGNIAMAGDSAIGGSGNLTLSGVVSGSAKLNKVGAGSLILTGVNTYSGGTNVIAGKLVLSGSGSINSSSGVSLTNGGGIVQGSSTALSSTVTASNGTIDGTGTFNTVLVPAGGILGNVNPGTSIAIGNLTLQAGSTLNFTTASTSPLFSVTNLSATGSGIVVNATNAAWNAGVYDLIGYSSLTGSLANFTKGVISGLTVRQSATLSNPAGFIALTISGDNPVWTGAQNGNWTVAAIAGSMNWKLITAGTPTDYIQGDTVRFDDSASGTTTVSISDANISPAQVIFANSGKTYTINGPFGIAGTGSVSITGTGTVTMNTQNAYSGGTSLSNGTLNINTASAIGTGPLTISGGGIDNTSGSPVALSTSNAQTWGSTINFGGSSDLNLGTGNVTLTAAPVVTTNNSANLTVGGNISGAFGLTKQGTGTLVLSGTSSYSGSTIISNGTLAVSGGVTGTLSTSGNSDIQVSPGINDNGTLRVSGGVVNANRVIIGGDSGNTAGGNAFVIQTGGTINSQQWFTVGSGNAAGASFPVGEYDLSAGTMNLLSQQMEVGNFFGTTGTVNMTGGNINLENSTSLALGANNLAGAGTFNQSGGNVTFYSNAGTTVGGTGILYLGKATSLTGAYTYNLNGGTLTVPQIQQTANSGGTGIFNFNGGTLRAAKANTAFMTGLSQANVGAGGAIIDDNGFAITIGQALSSSASPDGGLTKLGTGTLILTAGNGYNGATTISAGTLAVSGSGSINGTSAINVNGGKFLQLSTSPVTPTVTLANGTVGGSNGTINTVVVNSSATNLIANGNNDAGVLTIGSLTFSGAGAMTSTIAGAAATTAPGIVVNTLTTGGGTITVNAANALWNSSSVYDLIGYSTLNGSFSNFVKGTIAGLTPRQSATLTNPTGFIALSITSGDSPVWTGLQNANWTTAAISPAKNWKLQNAGTGTDFITGDTVIFDDTASGNTAVNISDANVSPTATTFNNSNLNYSITSTSNFGISGSGSVIKNGTASAALTTANTYTGGTTLNAGTLAVNNAAALGTGALTINGGKLDNTTANPITLTTNIPININGDFAFTGTANLSLGTAAPTIAGSGTSRTIAVNGGTLTLGRLVFTNYDFTKAGPGTLTILTPVTDNTAISSTTGSLNVTGGTLNIGANDFTATALTGGGTIANGSATTRALIINSTGSSTFSGTLADGGGTGTLQLTEGGAGTLTLSGSSTYTGQTTIINGGTIVMASPTALGVSTTVQLGGSFGTPSMGTLIVRTDGSDTAYNLNQGSLNTATLASDVLTGHVGINHTLGALAIGITSTLNVIAGPNVTSGTPSITVGAVSFTSGIGAGTTTFNPTTASLTMGNVTTTTATAKTLVLDGTAVGNAVTGVISDGANVVAVTKSNTSTWLLSGASTYTGDTNVSGGELDLSGSIADTNVNVASGATLKVLAGGSLSATTILTNSGNTSLGGVPITIASFNSSATGAVASLHNTTLKTSSLTLGGGTGSWNTGLDITNSKLILEVPGSNATTLAMLQDQVATGRTSTSGIFSSNLPANMGIAVMDNAVLNRTTFGTLAVDGGSVLVSRELLGDANADGSIDLTDLSTVLNNFGSTTSAWTSGNFDGASTIDLTDLSDVLNNFGASNPNANDVSPIPPSGAAPEPSSLMLLGLGGAMLLRRRANAGQA